VVGQARHRHPPQALAGLLAGEGQFQQTRQQDRVLEETLKKVPQPVEQHPLRLGRLEFHVVAQHRGQGRRIHLAVVVPAGQVRVGLGGVGVVLGRIPCRRWRLDRRRAGGLGALAGAGGRIGLQGGLIQQGACAGIRRRGLAGACGGCGGKAGGSGHAGGAEQISLADGIRHQRQLQFGSGRHGAGGGVSHSKGLHRWCPRPPGLALARHPHNL